jgi:hypothetical protein
VFVRCWIAGARAQVDVDVGGSALQKLFLGASLFVGPADGPWESREFRIFVPVGSRVRGKTCAFFSSHFFHSEI